MGAVYEAFDQRLMNTVALKQMLVTEEALKRAFEREAQLLARLRHPVLPKVIDHFTEPSGQFLVMEYMPGDDLGTLLDKRGDPFPYKRVLAWTDQLLETLHYLHTQPSPVIHRDIKPQNMKLTAEDTIVLLDFGLAKGSAAYQSHVSSVKSTYGYTPQYAPLEQMQSAGTDPRSDLYSLASSMYCLMTGSPPPGAMERANAFISQRPDPVRPAHDVCPDIPPAVSRVLAQAMTLNPADRPSSAMEMREQLRQARQATRHPPTDWAAAAEGSATIVIPEEGATVNIGSASQPGSPATQRITSQAGSPNTQRITSTSVPPLPSGFPEPPPLPPAPAAPPRQRGTALWIGGGAVLLLLVVLGVGVVLWDRVGGDDENPSPVAGGETSTATLPTSETTNVSPPLPSSSTEEAETPPATTTTEAQDGTATAQARVDADGATAVAEAEARTTRVVQTVTAVAEEVAVFHAEGHPDRVERHLTSTLPDATSAYAPTMESLLLNNGYAANIITISGNQALRPSQIGGPGYRVTWVRDLDYAASGYSAILGDMSVFRQNMALFLQYVTEEGVVPEAVTPDEPVYGDAWDSMPNLIHAAYAYVAKTGDREFYLAQRETLQRVGMWIVRLDSDGNHLPDRGDVFPYGYYNSINNNVMHTYALAKFYAAYRNLAELEQLVGYDGSEWANRATQMRRAFHRPFGDGGYWLDGLAWPIAWREPGKAPVEVLETFGVFEALRSGLIAPSDGEHYEVMTRALQERLPEMLDTPSPMRLALGGYPEGVLRTNVEVPRWKLDASAPWIVGLAAPAYARAGYPESASLLMQKYMEMARANDGKVLQLVAGEHARFGPGEDAPRGLTWDSAAWFMAVYGGHYGLTMTPLALVVEPHPFMPQPGDGITNLTYQGATMQLALDATAQTYRLQTDAPVVTTLRPMGTARAIQVNGGVAQEEVTMVLQPGTEYVVVSVAEPAEPATPPEPPEPTIPAEPTNGEEPGEEDEQEQTDETDETSEPGEPGQP
jgi:serine/threonine protein kinase